MLSLFLVDLSGSYFVCLIIVMFFCFIVISLGILWSIVQISHCCVGFKLQLLYVLGQFAGLDSLD